MAQVGLEAGIHVFTALLALLSAVAMLTALYTGSKDKKLIRALAILTALFVFITWISVAPVYTNEYGVDKTAIKNHPETALAHNLGMETKEHIFFTGVWLTALLPIFAYTLDLDSPSTRKLLMWVIVMVILGGLVMDSIGAWIGMSAKIAWQLGG